jgi:hypothetical protein
MSLLLAGVMGSLLLIVTGTLYRLFGRIDDSQQIR